MQVGNLVNGVCHFAKPQGSLGSICGCQPAARRLLNEKKMEACLGSVEFVLTFDASVHMVKSYRPIPDMSRQLPQRLIFLCKSPYNLHCLLTSNLGRNINSCYKLILILYHWWRELGLQTSSEQQEENISLGVRWSVGCSTATSWARTFTGKYTDMQPM